MLFKNKKIVKKKSFRKKSHKRKENMRKSHKRVGKEEIEKNERKRKIIEEKEVRMKEEEERRKRIDEAQKEEERRMKEEEKRMKEEEKRMKEDINFYKFIFTEPHEILYIDKNKIENESIFQPYLKTAVDRVINVDHKYQLDLKLYLLFLNSDKNIEELIKEKNINLFH
ncbi:hypothetical protein EB061_13070, partial [bacterium]|nr:hypothetical protein [bacterium]